MKIAFHSKEMSALSWAIRLQDEGHDVLVYTPPDKDRVKADRRIGDGLINKALSREQWMDWGFADTQTVWFFDCTDHGPLADRLRAGGRRVVGAGSFMDKLENDRGYGTAFAQRCGLLCPPERRFTTISAAVAWLRTNPPQQAGDGGWAWKPYQNLGPETSICVGSAEEAIDELRNVAVRKGDTHTGIVQERIKGVALSTNRWFNGASFTGPFMGTIEEKKFMNEDLGPTTGCSLNLVWMYPDAYPKVAKALNFAAVEDAFRREHAPPGLYDINAVFNRHGGWFLEWTPRLGIDSELASQRGITNMGEFLARLSTGRDVTHLMDSSQTYLSVRLTVPPYPSDDCKLENSPAMGVAVRGIDGLWKKHFVAVGIGKGRDGYEVTDPFGFVGVALATGTYLPDMNAELMRFCKKLRVRGLQYRTDASKIIGQDLDKLTVMGWPTVEVQHDAAA